MKEIHEFRIWADKYHLLPQPNSARFNGVVYVIKVEKDEPLFHTIEKLDRELRKKESTGIFGFWDVRRTYTPVELKEAELFEFKINAAFEPTGEECGTQFDENTACEICGANRNQIGPLKLKKGSIPKKDIARSIAGEVVVSARLVETVQKTGMRGISFDHVILGTKVSNYFQLKVTSPELEVTKQTTAGHNVFNLTSDVAEEQEFTVSGNHIVKFEKAVFSCPIGHLIGSRLISEPHVKNVASISEFDVFVSRQKVGVKQGLLRPEPIYFCSSAFREMILMEKLTGFDFEIARID